MSSRARAFWVVTFVSCALLACDEHLPSDRVLGDAWTPAIDRDAGYADAGDSGTDASASAAACVAAVASEHIAAREVVMSTHAGASENTGVFTTELYGQFVDHCGSCHTQGRNQGGFDLNRASFIDKITSEVLMRARSDDPMELMPPKSLPFSMRDPNAPIVRFVERLTQWFDAGKPADVFYPPSEDDNTSSESPYTLTKAVGMRLTNLGNCIPDKRIVSTAREAAEALDATFAAMQRFEDFPKQLNDTDLFTLDAEVLARHGTIAFAPGYTLWADNAKKMRHIRVPLGTSVEFDVATQMFAIPSNTRFYKTFLKRVVDLQGNARFRKMETRLIVSRPDRLLPNDQRQFTALYAAYKWNDDETEATLHEVRYRDGDGFTDDLRVYVQDERIEDQVVRAAPPDLDQALLDAGARRTYAIPGADRCVNCHMGAPDGSFVLGFTPLQINRRPLGEDGVIEPAAEHELNQLQRLIDYGVITGIDSIAQVKPLEQSQGGRTPRNDYELQAQGYMLGNCVHCHNPNGFPSQREPILKDTLDFLPSATGGIFQFPLDRMSARTFRGTSQDIRIPYISPSLFDNPRAVQDNDELSGAIKRSNKWIERQTPSLGEVSALGELASRFDAFSMMELNQPGRPLLAPWRSLIYRNVDAPFSYEDGGTIFPRMPMNTPGYDCRARRVLGSWMVSIPARREPLMSVPHGLQQYEELSGAEDQPYVEVTRDDDQYPEFVALAQSRLDQFRRSERFSDCPGADVDLVAPEVSSGRSMLPYPQRTTVGDPHAMDAEVYDLLSPARPHYPKTDLRDDPDWVIRRPDWLEVLVTEQRDPVKAEASAQIALSSAQTIASVRELQITPEIESAMLTERPFGLWREKPECESALSAMPRVSDFVGDARPSWVALANADEDAAVYMVSPGAQVFDMICTRCHGPEANGQSALASTIADLTGGLTRVANLRDGLFGPAMNPGANWFDEFGVAADSDVDAREWGARYVAWMGLGGTNAQIPATVLTKLRSGEVLGEQPQGSRFKPNPADAANMLTVAKLACEVFLPAFDLVFDAPAGRFVRESRDASETGTLQKRGLITRNGVAELWESLCHFNNPGPVRQVDVKVSSVDKVLFVSAAFDARSTDTERQPYYDIFTRAPYPSDALVGDQHGAITRGISSDNIAPWCLRPIDPQASSAAVKQQVFERIAMQLGVTVDALPWCPTQATESAARLTVAEGNRWAIRGAANAGLAVFLYLDALSHGRVRPKPSYDRCQDL